MYIPIYWDECSINDLKQQDLYLSSLDRCNNNLYVSLINHFLILDF